MQKKEMRYVVEPIFTGDNSAESEYANIPQYFDFLYVKRDGTSLTYKEFMEQITQKQKFLIGKLQNCNEEFKEEVADHPIRIQSNISIKF